MKLFWSFFYERFSKFPFFALLSQLPLFAFASNEYQDRFETHLPQIKRTHSNLTIERFEMEVVAPWVRKFAWAIPCDAAIATIVKYAPILEIGAGSGYWAFLISKAGADILAYDNFQHREKSIYSPEKLWFSVRYGSEKIASSYPTRTLLLVWPSWKNPFAAEALKRFKGHYVIYVGSLGAYSPLTGGSQFLKMVQRDFEKIEQIDLPNWPGAQDKLYVFERKDRFKNLFDRLNK